MALGGDEWILLMTQCHQTTSHYLGQYWARSMLSNGVTRSQWVKRERSGVTAHQIQDLINPDDIIKWKHFPCYWPFVWEIHRSPVNSPAQRPVTQSFDVFFDLHLSRQLSKQWRHWWFEKLPHSLWPHCNGENATWRVEWIKVSWIYIVKFYVQGK